NGLKIFIVESNREPTVTFRLLVRSGSAYDGTKTGLANLATALLDRGTKTRSADEFARQLDFIGASFNAGATSDATFVSADGLTKFQDKILDLFSDAVLHPAFPADELAKEKTKALSAIEAEKKSPGTLGAKLRKAIIFGTHPYGLSATEQSVKAIEQADVAAFHHTYFLPNNATLAIVGDVKADQVLEQIKKAFDGWKRGPIPKTDWPKFPEQKGVTIHLIDRPGSVQSNVLVAQKGVPRNNPMVPELNVLNTALGGGSSGRLFQNLREKHGWTYGAYSSFTFQKVGGIFSAGAEVRNEVTDLAIAEIMKELNRIRSEPMPELELALQRDYSVGNYLLSLESPERTAERVQEIDLYNLSKDFYRNYAKRLSGVTPPQALDLAKKYISTTDAAIIVVGDASQVKSKLEKFGKVQVYDADLHPLAPTAAK
ncbi:MAG: pitrilysin family protein, partial [Chthoniobacterales bacterium]